MGIPSQKHINHNGVPDGYIRRTSGEIVKEGDRVWSTSEAKFVPVKEFPNIIGEDAAEFWHVITKADI